jgi:uncharacterized protein
MKKSVWLGFVLLSAICAGQDIQVNRQNKTIAVTADESITADAEVAVLAIGFHNYGLTQDAAYRENVHAAEKIVNALMQAKVPAANIETEKLNLSRTEPDQRWAEEMKKQRVFEAQQSWHVNVSAAQAQEVVDMAVKAGANEIDDVEWNVVDAVALQAKASGAALAKARSIAEQMAKGLGTKVGELVYASNRAPVPRMWRGSVQTMEASAGGMAREEEPKLKLFPQKVKSDATVYAVFSIE